MIKTVLFDLGNVIFHFSHEKMCQQMGEVLGQSGENVRRFLFESGYLKQFETGALSETELHHLFEREFDCRVDFDALRLAGSDIFSLNQPIVPVLSQLSQEGIRLVLLSNTSVSHFEFLMERYDLLQKFDDFVLSYEVGACKPDAAIYQTALEAILCNPDECLYTDDIQENILGAIPFGLHARLFTTAEQLRKDLREVGIEIEELAKTQAS